MYSKHLAYSPAADSQCPLSDLDNAESTRLLSVSSLAGGTAVDTEVASEVPFTTPKTFVTSVESGIEGAVSRRAR